MDASDVERLLQNQRPPGPPESLDRRILALAAARRGDSRSQAGRGWGRVTLAASVAFCLAIAGWLIRPDGHGTPAPSGPVLGGGQENPPPRELATFLERLSSDDVSVRDEAQRALRDRLEKDPREETVLAALLADVRDAEVRSRLEQVLRDFRDRKVPKKVVEKAVLSMGVGEYVARVAFSPDGRRLLTVSGNGPKVLLRLWGVPNGSEVASIEAGPGVWPDSFTFLPGTKFILGAGPGVLAWFDSDSLKEVKRVALGRKDLGIDLMAPKPGGEIVAFPEYLNTTGKRKRLRQAIVLYAADGRELSRRVFPQAEVGGSFLRWSPDGSYLIADLAPGVESGKLESRDLVKLDGRSLETLGTVAATPDPYVDAAVSSDGAFIAAFFISKLSVLDPGTLRAKGSLRLPFQASGEFSRGTWMNGRTILSWGPQATLEVASFSSAGNDVTLIHRIEGVEATDPRDLSPDGKWIAYSARTNGSRVTLVRVD